MRKFLLLFFLLFLFIAPLLTIKPVYNYYAYYENIAKKYDCYPIKNCSFDFNGDGKSELFSVVADSTEKEPFNFRLKIFIESDSNKKQILNVKYDPTDNTFRTHVAAFEEAGTKKLTIYDTVNSQQFFVWNGEQFLPSENPSVLEREIWKAMSLEDDTGGFNQKIGVDLILIFWFGIYYLVVVSVIGLVFYLKRKSKLNLL